MDMMGTTRRAWIAALVVLHLVISIVHGAAHDGAHVPLSRAANLFVFIVILGGPLAGLLLLWRSGRAGAWLIGATMAASLVFGLTNHFVLPSPDHVAQVARQWRPLFASTAVLLALTEALTAALAFRVARERTRTS
jgi:Ni,Fe-hydrogenase I cytochrome b subunit